MMFRLKFARERFLGIAGVEGNGQTELIEALAGLVDPSRLSGEIRFEDQDITQRRRAVAARVGHCAHSRRPASPRFVA